MEGEDNPNPAGPHRTDRLLAVDASSGSSVWAVGFYEARSGRALRSLVLRWNGSAWRRVRSPNPGHLSENVLTGVSVRSRTDVWAVGYQSTATGRHALILHWDGSDWTRFTIPDPPGSRGRTHADRGLRIVGVERVGCRLLLRRHGPTAPGSPLGRRRVVTG